MLASWCATAASVCGPRAAPQVSPEEVETVLRDGIEYYIDSALEPDFEQSDADLYEALPLEHVDENIGKLATKHERPAEASEVRGFPGFQDYLLGC